MKNSTSTCYDIPAHLHIHIWSVITSVVEGVPQREIRALQVRYVLDAYRLQSIAVIQKGLLIIAHNESLHIKNSVLLAIAHLTGRWTVVEVLSLHVWTQRSLSCSPSPPLSHLLTFLSTPDHQKPGA